MKHHEEIKKYEGSGGRVTDELILTCIVVGSIPCKSGKQLGAWTCVGSSVGSISSNGLVGVNTTGPWGAYMVEIDGNN